MLCAKCFQTHLKDSDIILRSAMIRPGCEVKVRYETRRIALQIIHLKNSYNATGQNMAF